jgi:hypothetical protein
MKDFAFIISLVIGFLAGHVAVAGQGDGSDPPGLPPYVYNPDDLLFDPNDALFENPWSVMLYRGWTSERDLRDSLLLNYEYANEDMYAGELAYTLARSNPISELFDYIGAAFQLATSAAYRRDNRNNENVAEFCLYFMLRWRNFPWNRYIATTFAVGEGISYATDPPEIEKEDDGDRNDSQSLLNYLVFEATFALPKHPRVQLVYRLHHRSGAYEIFDESDFGSNVLGFGLRYHF